MVDLFSSAFIIFTTRQYAIAADLSLSATSRKLARLEQDHFITRITKGVWANTKHPWFDARACVPYLLGNEQGYISFLTQLHDSGVLSQIPKTIQVATSGHGRKLSSPVGDFEFFQIKPEWMREGVVWSETKTPYLVAEPEKELLDCFYLATRKSRRFSKLPELDVSSLDFRKMQALIKRAPLPDGIKTAMKQSIAEVDSAGAYCAPAPSPTPEPV